jgi:DNA-binding NtrC family response regulator
MKQVLIVEDEAGVRESLERVLADEGYGATGAASLPAATALLVAQSFDAVLLDLRLGEGDGLSLLAQLKTTSAAVPVIITTAYSDSEHIIDAIKGGAFDYVTKPFDLPRLLQVLKRALESGRASPTPELSESPGELLGSSEAMVSVWKLIAHAARSQAPVLITGETGTGKELVARAIHRHGARAAGPFIAVNVASLPPSLIESELFGHERGAFTGAVALKRGRLELAAGGTLFLDEIGDLERPLQTRLLRFLQEREFERVGGQVTLSSDARVIAATHRTVKPGSEGSPLREDLYFRLAVIELHLPPLRERRGDVAELARRFAAHMGLAGITPEAAALLGTHLWPGNVRELKHLVERAAVVRPGQPLDAEGVMEALGHPIAGPRESTVDHLLQLPLREAVDAFERFLLVRALERAGGNRARAARDLGIPRSQLYAKLHLHGIGGEPP